MGDGVGDSQVNNKKDIVGLKPVLESENELISNNLPSGTAANRICLEPLHLNGESTQNNK